WVTVMVPAKTPEAVAEALNAAFNDVIHDADVRQRLVNSELNPKRQSLAEAGRFLQSELATWGRTVGAIGLKLKGGMRAAATFFQLSPCKNYCYLPPDRGKREQTQSSGRIPMRKLQRQLLAVAGMLAAFAVTAPSGSAQTSTQNWPTRPVKFIVSLGA